MINLGRRIYQNTIRTYYTNIFFHCIKYAFAIFPRNAFFDRDLFKCMLAVEESRHSVLLKCRLAIAYPTTAVTVKMWGNAT